jgi:hypothetical protein
MRTSRGIAGAVVLAVLASGGGGVGRAQNQPATPTSGGVNPNSLPIVIPELRVDGKVYDNVQVRDITPQSIIIFYSGGLTSLPLADLPPDLQQRFGYDPGKAAADAAREQAEAEALRAKEAGSPLGGDGSMFAADRILQSFGQAPKIFAEVNMRPRFEQLGIYPQNQGARPSCAVFAMVSALEFQESPPNGPAPALSEEYLIWATLKTLGMAGLRFPKKDTPGFDVGFSLLEVSQALRAYGIALEGELPYQVSAANPIILTPDDGIVDRAKLRSPANGFWVTGRDPATRISGIVDSINQGVPVVVGLKWPEDAALDKTGFLDTQTALESSLHAVLFIGYRSSTGKLEDCQFLFKNSYGSNWGDHGYGLVTYRYLAKNLDDALFLDVR